MKHIHLTFLAAAALCMPLAAQNINQSVQVTNDYVTRFADFQKLGPALQAPDSLLRFDYDFDYSVFETPYKGSYEFSPYRIEVTPEARLYDGGKFFLRAGAGYSFHPQFELAWQMLQEKNFSIGIFGEAGGFAGRYRRRGLEGTLSGHDLNGRIGLGGQYLLPSTRLSYHLGLEGIFAGESGEEPDFRSSFTSAVISGRIQSRERPDNHMFYDIDLRYRYSGDNCLAGAADSRQGEHNIRVAASLGPVLDSKYSILLDALFEMDALKPTSTSSSHPIVSEELLRGNLSAGLASLKPHVDFLLGPVLLDAGVRIDYSAAGENKRFSVRPDVMARFALLDADLELYAGVSGGQSLQDHYTIKQINHFVRRADASATVSMEQLRVRGGLQGHWGTRLQYEAEAGYVSYDGAPLAAIYNVLPTDYTAFYGQAGLSWKDERLELDGGLAYRFMRFSDGAGAFAPPVFTADLRGRYNWDRRIWAGAFLEGATGRKQLGVDDAIRGYVNLGLTGEFRIDSRWTAWIEAGNLLGMAIERAPGYIEKGPYATVGLSLRL